MQIEDAGSYECQASTKYHTSSAAATVNVIVHGFEVVVFPRTLEVEIGQKATFTCDIFPTPSPDTVFSFKWSRTDNVAISATSYGIYTKTLTIVSIYLLSEVLVTFDNIK